MPQRKRDIIATVAVTLSMQPPISVFQGTAACNSVQKTLLCTLGVQAWLIGADNSRASLLAALAPGPGP